MLLSTSDISGALEATLHIFRRVCIVTTNVNLPHHARPSVRPCAKSISTAPIVQIPVKFDI